MTEPAGADGMPQQFDALLEAIKEDLVAKGKKAARYAGPLGIKKFVSDIQAAFDQASASAVCLGILNVAAGFGGAERAASRTTHTPLSL